MLSEKNTVAKSASVCACTFTMGVCGYNSHKMVEPQMFLMAHFIYLKKHFKWFNQKHEARGVFYKKTTGVFVAAALAVAPHQSHPSPGR